MDEFHDQGWRFAAAEARRVAGDGPTYLSFDIDAWTRRRPPAPARPEAGGITALEALRLLRELRGIDFVGGDLVEVAPPFDVGGLTAFNGASILFEILCLLVEARNAAATTSCHSAPPIGRPSVRPKQGQGSALKPARGLCPLDPHQRRSLWNPSIGSGEREGGPGSAWAAGHHAGGRRCDGQPPRPTPVPPPSHPIK